MSTPKKLSLVDSGFLILENRRIPQHVGSVALFTLPKGEDETEFLHGLADYLKQDVELCRPFGHVLKTGPLGVLGPMYWEDDKAMDLEYHVRHSALPKPGRYRELFALVSRLHGTLLDRTRPLWEIHLIEGLQNRQFALYSKMHHSTVDGVGGTHLMRQMYSADPAERISRSPFSIEAAEAYRSTLAPVKRFSPSKSDYRAVSEFLSEQFGHTVNISRAISQFAGVWMGRNTRLSVPWHKVPKTPLNTRVDGARRFVAQSWPIERVKAVGKAFDGTLNDAVLAMCSGALRRYLLASGNLPDESLKAMAPISLRATDDLDSSNAVAFIAADLATNISDPNRRVRAIHESMQAGKEQLHGMTKTEIELYLTITQSPMMLVALLGLAGKFPAFSTTVSNVPGPREQLYWNGARMDGLYPASIVVDGMAVNFTLQSNYDRLDFGIIACRRSVPNVQRLIDYLEEALVEMEEACGLKARPKRRRAAPKAAKPKRKAAAGSSAKAKARTKRKAQPKGAAKTAG